MTKKARKTGKRTLALFMTVLMLMSAWVFVAPTAKAGSTTYSWRIWVKTTNSADCNDNGDIHKIHVYGKAKNGTGGETTIWEDNSVSSDFFQNNGRVYEKSGTSTSFPYKWYIATRLDGSFIFNRKWEGDVKLYINGTEVYSGNHYNQGNNKWDDVSREIDNSHYPYATTRTISGSTDSTYVCDGQKTASYGVSGSEDQWGVNWTADVAWSSNNSNMTVTTPGSTTTATFKTATANYNPTLTATFTDANNSHTDGTATKAITVYAVHNWTNNTDSSHLKTAATCESPAVYYKSCSRCGANGTATFESGSALGHNYTGAVHSLNNGTHNWACKNGCGTYGKVENGTQVKNGTVNCTYGSWSADTATCTAAGSHSRTCSACGYTDTQSTPSLGHQWGAPTYTWATNGSSCTAQRVCSRDSSHKETESGAISSSVTTPATCEGKGKTTYTATFTNSAFSTQTKVIEDIPALGHSWKYSEAVFNWNGYACPNATLTCARDANHTTTVNTTVTSTITVSPTCEGTGVRTYTAKFTVNGTDYTSLKTEAINPNGHDWNYAGATYSWSGYSSCTAHVVCNTDSSHTIDIPATSISSSVTTTATCVVDGIRTYTATFDNNQLSTQTTTENLGKDLNNHVHTHNVAATTSTCQDHGYTAGVYCDDCHTYISGHQQLPLVDHKFTTYTYNNDATCTVDGTETASCDYNCGTTDTRTKAGTAKGHDYTGATISTGENGGHKYLCNNGCGTYGKVEGSTQVTDGVEAHTWGSYTVLTSATCGDPGLARYTCTKCTQTHTEPIPATGNHTWVAGTETPATCAATGTQPYECSVCHATKSDVLPIDATNHTNLQGTARKEATCQASGNIEYWYCSGCGNYYDNAAGTSQIEQLDTVIAKLEHSYTGAIQNNNNGTHSFKCVNGCNQYGGTVACTYGDPVINPVATCQTHGIQTETCTACGYKKETDLGLGDHNWGDWVQTKAPNCTEKGEETRYCQTPNCGEEETRDVDPLGHNWSEEWTIDIQPGCLTAGSKSHHCLRCLTEKTDITPIDPLGHDWGDWVRTTEPTCLGIGKDTRTCGRCGATETRDVDPLGHDWESEWTVDTEPNCTHAGSKSHHCKREGCDAKNDVTAIDPLGHDWGEWTVTTPATCLAAGEKERECGRCHVTETGSVAKLEHSYTGEVKDNDDGTHSFKCVNGCNQYGGTVSCEATYGEWSADTATCTATGEQHRDCSVCGHRDTRTTQMKPHTFTKEDPTEACLANGATCTAPAEYFYSCVNCGLCERDSSHVFASGDPLGHDWTGTPKYVWSDENHHMTATVWCKNDGSHVITEEVDTSEVITIEPTCTDEGEATYTATFTNDPELNEYHGTTFFTTQTTTSEVDKLPHTLTTHVEAAAPTCSDPGNIEYWICSECGGYFKDVGGYYPTTAEGVVLQIDPDAHDYGPWTPNGETGHTKVCSYNEEHNQSEAHTWANIVSAATKATNDGPICENGEAYYKTCSVCGYISTTEIFTTQASGHKLVYVPAVAPTCTDDGSIAHYQCGACGKYFSDAAAENELTAAELVDPATGHNFTGAYRDNGDGTHSRLCVNGCGTYGATAEHAFTEENAGAAYAVSGQTADCTHEAAYYYSCVCGACENDADHTFTSGGSLGHVLGEIAAVTATCAADGHDAYWHCSRCGKFFTDENATSETDPADHVISHSTIAHTWPADWTETQAATCTDIGKEERTCSVCGLTETRDIPKLQHSFTGDVVSFNDGTHAHKCVYGCGLVGTVENCEDSKTQISSTAANCTTMGDTTYKCTVCDYQWTVVGTGYGPHDGTFTHHDAVAATCTTAGNIEYWTCDLCGVMFSDEDHTVEVADVSTPALNHEGIAPVEQVNATCTEPGVKAHAECPLCGKMFSDVTASHEVNADDLAIPAKGHDFHGAIQDKDASEHWYKCTRCDVYGGAEAHSYTRALAIADAKKSDATCTASATYYYSCACGRINNAEGADTFTVGSPTGHAYNSVKAGSWTWTKVSDTYTAKVTLVCANDPNHETERDAVVTFTTDAPNCTTAGTRHYTATVTLDDGSTDSDTKDETVPVVGHSMVATAAKAPTCEEAGYEAYWTCSVCKKLFSDANAENEIDEIVTINALGHDWGTPTYTWSKDGDTYICIAEEVCSRNDQHIKTETATADAQVTQDPTCIAMGKTTYTATFNDADFEQQTQTLTDVAMVPHTLTKTDAVEATCHVEGHDAYWTCSVCDKIFSDENGDHEIEAVVSALDPDNHKTLVHHAKVDATCLADGNIEYWHCNDCGLDLVYNDAGKLVATTDTVIPAGPDYHRFTTHVSAREATCTQQGNVEYWTCAACGKHFDGNTAAANELTDVSVAANGHTFEHTAAVPATCTVDGNKEYWYCTVCHQYFLTGATNASDTLAVPFSETVDPMLHHDEKNVEGKAATCTTVGNKAYSYCSRCGTILTLDGVDVSLNGWTKSDNANVYTIEALGHAYGDPTWVWADDYSSATATRVCANDASHTLTETDNDIATVVVPKTHTTDGKTTYTAEVTFAFDNKTYTDVVEVVDAASGHHTTKVNPKDATCEEAGNREYWICEDEGCGKLFVDEAALVETTLDAVTIPALGHNWVNPTWTWTMNGDYYTGATLTFTCANDATHKQTPEVTFTANQTDPDCTNAGKIVYTATATFEGKTYTDTKEVALEKTGHTLTATAAKDATCEEAGNIAYWTCSVCNKIFSDENARYEITAADTVIAALGHTYDYAHTDYDWSADHSSCTATATCIRCDATDTETKASTNDVKIPATCEAQGIRIYTVDFENENFATQTYDELIPATGHGTAVAHEGEEATCEAAGFEAYWTCAVCGKLFKAETLTAANEIANPIVIPATGHNWDYENVDYNWSETEPYTCTATVTCKNDGSHKKAVTGSVTITDSTEADCVTDGSRTYTATFPADTSIPNATKTATTAALGHDFSESVDRAHVVDGTHHNYKCARCDAYGIMNGNEAQANASVACTFHGDWYVSENESCTEPGSEWRQCDFCSNKETREREALTHQVFSVAAQEATCVAIGNKAYTYCERCGLLLTVDGDNVETQNIKFNADAAIALYKTEDMLNHDLKATAAKAATCEEDGNIAYWTCERCGKIFNTATPASNEAAITLADTVIAATKHVFTGAVRDNGDNTHSKQCTKCDAYGIMVNGTPVKDGKEACYGGTATCTDAAICSVCGHAYQAKLGHNYVLQSWTWNGYTAATAHYVCTRDVEHTKDVEATVNKTDATVTCTTAGQNTYVATATFTDGDKTYTDTDTKTEVVNATGHNWDFENAVYSWDANQNCTVTLKCLNDADHIYTEIGKNTTATTPATCEGTGSVKYTATFTINSSLTSEHTETLAALGHKWGDPAWTWTGNDTDGYTATVKLVCDRVASHEATPDVIVTKDTVAPTCEKDGRTVYTATATLDGRTYKDTKITIQPATGHDWQAPVFIWTEAETGGYSAAIAMIACNNDHAHDQTLNCALTTETDDATCTSGGTVTYTATVTFNGTSYTDTKTATVDELGHNYEFAGFNWSGDDATGYTATVANFVCANDNSHTKTAPATVTTETVAAICEADGKITYTAKATFEGVEYTDAKIVVIPMLHHNWGETTYTWVKDGDQYQVTALRTCANNPTEHQQTETVRTTSGIVDIHGHHG